MRLKTITRYYGTRCTGSTIQISDRYTKAPLQTLLFVVGWLSFAAVCCCVPCPPGRCRLFIVLSLSLSNDRNNFDTISNTNSSSLNSVLQGCPYSSVCRVFVRVCRLLAVLLLLCYFCFFHFLLRRHVGYIAYTTELLSHSVHH